MTTENSVREPDLSNWAQHYSIHPAALAALQSLLAAPAPAGSLPEQGANPCKCIDCGGTEPGHSPDCTFMAELHSEQGAGLAEQWKEAAAIYREQGRNDIADVFDDCASALARQQSRVVDEDAQDAIDSILKQLEDWSRAYPTDIFHEPTQEERDWLHATKPGLMDCIAASMGRHMAGCIAADLAALRAALEGARDGR